MRRRPALLSIFAFVAVIAAAAIIGVQAAVPPISEDFMFISVEFDDTDKTESLRQAIFQSLTHHRMLMTAQGSLVQGYLQQLTRCDYSWSGSDGAKGIFTQVFAPSPNASSSEYQCQNMTIDGEQWSPFWDFPENATYTGKAVPPSGNYKRAFHRWNYWSNSERYELYLDLAAGNVAKPVWNGKVQTWVPGYHLWHIEYFGFEAVEPSINDFKVKLPAGVTCSQKQQQEERGKSEALLRTFKKIKNGKRRVLVNEKGLPLVV